MYHCLLQDQRFDRGEKIVDDKPNLMDHLEKFLFNENQLKILLLPLTFGVVSRSDR